MDVFEAGILPVNSQEAFDVLRAGWTKVAAVPKVVSNETVAVLNSPLAVFSMLLCGEDTAGQIGLYHQAVPAGADVPGHHQNSEDEGFYILEGRWRFVAGEDAREVGPGDLIYAPVGTTHAFRPLDDEGGDLISWNAPAGHERFYTGMMASAMQGENPFQMAAPNYRTFFEGVAEGDAPLPRHMSSWQKASPMFSFRADAPEKRLEGAVIATLLAPEMSGGRTEAVEISVEGPGVETPHDLAGAARILHVLEGRWHVRAGELEAIVGRGQTVFVPGDVALSYRSDSEGPARLFFLAEQLNS